MSKRKPIKRVIPKPVMTMEQLSAFINAGLAQSNKGINKLN